MKRMLKEDFTVEVHLENHLEKDIEKDKQLKDEGYEFMLEHK